MRNVLLFFTMIIAVNSHDKCFKNLKYQLIIGYKASVLANPISSSNKKIEARESRFDMEY